MFGALLGALSSTGGASAKTAKRRADIEKRQADKLKQLEADVSKKERQQAEDITKTRGKEQWDVDAAAVGVLLCWEMAWLIVGYRCVSDMQTC